MAREHFEHLADFEVPVAFTYEATVPNFAVRDADGLRVGGTVLEDLTRSLARTETRVYTLDLGSESRYVEDRTLRAPSGFTIGSVPTGGTLESPFGQFVMTVAPSAREVRVHTELSIARDTIPASEYAAFRAWVSSADALLRSRIVLIGGAR